MKQLSLLLLLSTANFLSAMEQDKHMVMVPSQKVLFERLQPIKEYEHFFSTNNFITTFAGTKRYAPEVFAPWKKPKLEFQARVSGPRPGPRDFLSG